MDSPRMTGWLVQHTLKLDTPTNFNPWLTNLSYLFYLGKKIFIRRSIPSPLGERARVRGIKEDPTNRIYMHFCGFVLFSLRWFVKI